MTRVIVCGSRDATEESHGVARGLDAWHRERPIMTLATGCASGVDSLAFGWSLRNKIEGNIYRADWPREGRRAGPIRNSIMLMDERHSGLALGRAGMADRAEGGVMSASSEVDDEMVVAWCEKNWKKRPTLADLCVHFKLLPIEAAEFVGRTAWFFLCGDFTSPETTWIEAEGE